MNDDVKKTSFTKIKKMLLRKYNTNLSKIIGPVKLESAFGNTVDFYAINAFNLDVFIFVNHGLHKIVTVEGCHATHYSM